MFEGKLLKASAVPEECYPIYDHVNIGRQMNNNGHTMKTLKTNKHFYNLLCTTYIF